MKINFFIIAIFAFLPSACSVQNATSPKNPMLFQDKTWNTETPPPLKEITKAVNEKKVDEKLDGMTNWWLYGPGMGRTMLNVGTVIIFPPYALYLLTNAGLALSGFETIKPVEVLPDEPKEVVNKAFDDVTSVPGRVTAYFNDKEYIEQLPSQQ